MGRLAQAALQRAGDLLDLINGTFEGLLGVMSHAVLALPPTIFTILVGLAAWRGQRLPAGLVAIAGMHLITFGGAWDQTVRTVLGGLLAAIIAVAVTTTASWLWRLLRLPSVGNRASRSLTVGPAIVVGVLLLALTPLLSGPTFHGWILVSGLITTVLLVASLQPSSVLGDDDRRVWLWSAVLAGCSARLVTEAIAGEGLGGLVASAATGTDLVAALSAALVLLGLVAILMALTGEGWRASHATVVRGPASVAPSQDEDDRHSGTSKSRGDP